MIMPAKLKDSKTAKNSKKQTISKKLGKKKEPNPLDRALEILEGYSEGTPPEKMCECCEK